MGYAMNGIFNIEEITQAHDLNFGRLLKQFEISSIIKNLSSEPVIMTDLQIDRFEKNEIKKIFGKSKDKNSIIYGIGCHIYWNRGKEFRKLL